MNDTLHHSVASISQLEPVTSEDATSRGIHILSEISKNAEVTKVGSNFSITIRTADGIRAMEVVKAIRKIIELSPPTKFRYIAWKLRGAGVVMYFTAC